MRKLFLGLMVVFCICSTARAGVSHKTFKNAPSQVFAAAVQVANRGHDVVIDAKQQTVTFSTGTSGAYLGVNRLIASFSGLPDGCGGSTPCTATEVQIKCERVTPDTMGFRLCSGDVNRFFGRLKGELKKMPLPVPDKSAPVNGHV